MKFMLLIYGDESAMGHATDAERQQQADAYDVFTKSIVETGQFLDGDPFLPTTTSQTVKVRDGATQTGSGPADTAADQLLAYYKVEAAGPEEAAAMAARIPGAHYGTIEVRPVMTFD